LQYGGETGTFVDFSYMGILLLDQIPYQ